jgi:hypothetical protein
MSLCRKKKNLNEGWPRPEIISKLSYEDMTHTPLDESELIEDPIFFNMK